MSRLYDAAEPGVIDEELLSQLVNEQGPQKEAGRIARAEGIEFTEVHHLRLDFKNMQQIENLWQFTNLTKLQLDNNIISDIKGLEKLVHLEWLDLSFNNIKDITGLDNLINLRDLSLAHNLIQCIRGLDSLSKLQVLSLGFNQLDNLKDAILYLRTITSIESLCLKGNEFSPVPPHDEETRNAEIFTNYQTICLAYLPNLIYLDYQMASKDAHIVACEQHKDDLVQLMAEEKQDKIKKEENRKRKDYLQLLNSAYMNGFAGEDFYEFLFEEDVDAFKLSLIPGEKERLVKYHDTVVKTAKEILEIGLAEKEKRDQDRSAFFAAHKGALDDNQRQSVELIEKYEGEKSEPLKNSQFESLGEKITDLHYELMKKEMILVEQQDEMIKDFDRSYNEMIGGFIEKIQALTTLLRDLEKERHEALTEDVTVLLDSYVKGHIDDDTPDDVLLLLSDKDSLLGALNSSHDSHMLAIDNKEDGIRNRINKDAKTLMDDLTTKESSRNRQRVMEIKHYIELQQEELEEWLNTGQTNE